MIPKHNQPEAIDQRNALRALEAKIDSLIRSGKSAPIELIAEEFAYEGQIASLVDRYQQGGWRVVVKQEWVGTSNPEPCGPITITLY